MPQRLQRHPQGRRSSSINRRLQAQRVELTRELVRPTRSRAPTRSPSSPQEKNRPLRLASFLQASQGRHRHSSSSRTLPASSPKRRRASRHDRRSRRKAGREAIDVGIEQDLDEEKADMIYLWPQRKSVPLMNDFLRSNTAEKTSSGPDPAEMRLLYVAVRRVKESLEVPSAIMGFTDRRMAPQRERVEAHRTSSVQRPVQPRQVEVLRPSSPAASATPPRPPCGRGESNRQTTPERHHRLVVRRVSIYLADRAMRPNSRRATGET